MSDKQPNPLPCGCAVYGTKEIDTMGTKMYYTNHFVKHCEFHANARAREQALREQLERADLLATWAHRYIHADTNEKDSEAFNALKRSVVVYRSKRAVLAGERDA